MTSTERNEFAITEAAAEALQATFGTSDPADIDDPFIVFDDLLGRMDERNHDCSPEFMKAVALATVVRFARAGEKAADRRPTVLLVPELTPATVITTHRPLFEAMGLELGLDVLVHNGLAGIWSVLQERDQQPGMVVIHYSTGCRTASFEPWLEEVASTAPVLRWEYLHEVFRRPRPSPSPSEELAEIYGFDDEQQREEQGELDFDSLFAPAEVTGYRQEECRQAMAHLLRPAAPVLVFTGRPGSGRSTFLQELEAEAAGHDLKFVRFQFDPLVRRPTDELTKTCEQLVERGEAAASVVVIDDFDDHINLTPDGRGASVVPAVRLCRQTWGIKFLLVIDHGQGGRIRELDPQLADTAEFMTLAELPRDHLLDIVGKEVVALAGRAGLEVADDVAAAALEVGSQHGTQAHPGLALTRVDVAIGRARLQGAAVLEARHFVTEAGGQKKMDAIDLEHRLGAAVVGQQGAIATVAETLAAPLAGFKVRPDRPHGVFLFAGPTGVGKTELARQIAATVYGSTDAMITLDMSEYAAREDGLIKLVGAHRVWKNSSTHGLLTTRIIDKPRCVVLLDEFEKAHPDVWQVFLQVFDEGRLTDGWGNTADFSETIIILTSNLGVREATAGTDDTTFDHQAQKEAIAAALPPELLNRLSATVGFDPLSHTAIRELAAIELGRLAERIGGQGKQVRFDTEVIDWIADTGFDPRYGARNLQRNISNEFLRVIAGAPESAVRVIVGDYGLEAEPLDAEPFEGPDR